MAPWAALKRQLGLARKLLRLGKPVEHLRAAAVAWDASPAAGAKTKPSSSPSSSSSPAPCFLRYAAVARQLAYAAYLTLDALVLPDALGAHKWRRAPALQRQAHRFWAAGILFSLAAQLYTLRRLARREAAIDRKDGEGVVEAKRIKLERSASRLQLLCDLCDLTIPTSALGWLAFDDGFVGLAGTLSSLVGLHTQWDKTA
ncbi:hypothetical protein CDD83_975 [Cordyceps sp. RAO-2017]|nr:hypothetical protein CDD83_975 [Cordyceps sp. RAO-2017]